MEQLVAKFAHRFATTEEISEASHRDILAYKRTTRNKAIDYRLNFKDDILQKNEEDLSPAEEHFLISLALNGS